MADITANSEVVAQFAEEFAERFRRGERPPISEYVDRCPQAEQEIREVLSALAHVERLAPSPHDDLSPNPSRVGDLPPLQQFGDFRIVREAGRGGMGIVYEAEQVSLGRRVALKVLPQHLLAGEKQRKRFEREAKAAARLHHTNIVPVFGVGEQDGLHYYVMQFIYGLGLDEVIVELRKLRQESEAGQATTQPKSPGREHAQAAAAPVSAVDVAHSLLSGHFQRTVLVEDLSGSSDSTADDFALNPPPPPATPTGDTAVGRLSDTAQHSFALPGQSTTEHGTSSRKVYWESVARMGLQTAQALQYAHDQGVIHRDIKPGNLLLDTQGTVWVTDFGLAKATDQQDLTHTGDVLGTLRYMAPEQFEGTADARSDVYSLGLTLYELLALQPAFDQTNRRQLIKQVTEGTPTRLRSLDHHIPRDLETIVHKAIDRDPSHRYQSAGDVAADLQRYLGDEPIKAKWVSPITRFARWCKRNPAVAGLTTTIALLLIAAAIGSSLAAVRFQDLADEETKLAGDLTDALRDAEHNLELVKEQEQIAKANLTLANSETKRAEEALARVTAEQQRAEGNLDLALAALDAVYLDAIGEEKLMGEPQPQPEPGDEGFSPSARPPLSDLEKELLNRGLKFYDQFAQQNAATPRAALQTAQAHYRVGLLQAALGDHTAAESAHRAAVERFERLAKDDPTNAAIVRQLAKSYYGVAESMHWRPDARDYYVRALETFSKVLSLDPKDHSSVFTRASIHQRINEYHKANDEYKRAIELAPNDAHYHQVYAAFLQFTQVPEIHNVPLALQHQTEATRLEPQIPYHQARLGRLLAATGKTEEALAALDRAIELDPHDASGYNQRSVVLRLAGKLDQALQDAEKAVELEPDSGWQHRRRAEALQALKRYDDAFASYAMAESKDPSNPYIFSQRGDLYREWKQPDLALADYDKTLQLRPDWWYVRKRRAEAYFSLAQYSEALADLKMALKQKPQDLSTVVWLGARNIADCPDENFKQGVLALADEAIEHPDTDKALAHRYRAELRAAMGRPEAMDDYTWLIENQPNQPVWLLRRGLMRRGAGDEAGAEADVAAYLQPLTEAIEQHPDDPDVWDDRGEAYVRVEQYDNALADFTRMIEVAGDDVTGHHYRLRGNLYREHLDDLEAALQDYNKAVEIDPENENSLPKRALAAMGLGQWQVAIDDYTRLIEQRPKERGFLLSRARARQASGDDVGAEADFNAYLKPYHDAVTKDESNWQTWNRRGVALAKLERWEAALADFENAAEIAPDKPVVQTNLKAVFVEQSRWAEAAEAVARLVELEAAGWREEYELALLSLSIDQPSVYRKACQRMLEAGAETTDAVEANFIVWTAALAADAMDNYDATLALAHQALETTASNHQYLNSLGAILYRAGQYEAARARLTELASQLDNPETKANSSPAYCWYFLAMTHHALGQTDEAGNWLNKANDWTTQVLADEQNPPPWNRRLTLQLLRDEASALIGTEADTTESDAGDSRRPPAPPLPTPADTKGEDNTP